MKNLQNKVVVIVGLLAMAGAASAQESGADYSTIVAAVSIGTVVTGIVAMGAVKILPNVASWASNKLANFFR